MTTAIRSIGYREALEASVKVAALTVAQERHLDPETIYDERVCRPMSSAAALQIMSAGFDNVRLDSRAGRSVDEHRYVVIGPDPEDIESEEVIVDSSWRQFLPDVVDTSGYPKVLIGSRAEVIAEALAAGVASQDAAVWQAAGPKTAPRHLLPHELIAQAIDQQQL